MVSVPAKLTLSGALNQPFAFGAREAAALACGADASYFKAKDAVPVLPA